MKNSMLWSADALQYLRVGDMQEIRRLKERLEELERVNERYERLSELRVRPMRILQ